MSLQLHILVPVHTYTHTCTHTNLYLSLIPLDESGLLHLEVDSLNTTTLTLDLYAAHALLEMIHQLSTLERRGKVHVCTHT